MPRSFLAVAFLLLAGILAACRSEAEAPSTATRDEQPIAPDSGRPVGKIAINTNRDGNSEIYVMNADGSGPQRLTNDPDADKGSSWSPDGQRIAFFSGRDGNAEIYVMNADGTAPRRLTDNSAQDVQAFWSPDGKKIAFASERDGNAEIYVMNADGSAPQRLTNHPASDFFPAWSPDGKKIAFRSNREEPNPLTCSPCNDEIYVMNADGSGVQQLTSDPAFDFGPSWSPDGKQLAFASDRDGDFEVYVMNADGSRLERLTDNEAADTSPDWSPDGKSVAFASDGDGDAEIYVMNADGSEQRPITDNADNDADPVWRPEAHAAARWGASLVIPSERGGEWRQRGGGEESQRPSFSNQVPPGR